MEPKLEVLTDSSANLGMHNRIGSGRVRHLDVKWLWTQEAVQSGRFLSEEKMCWDGIEQRGTWHETDDGYLWILVGMDPGSCGICDDVAD